MTYIGELRSLIPTLSVEEPALALYYVSAILQNMPLIKISMYPGRSAKQKDEFARAVTKAATEILGAQDKHVIVVFEENPSENWFHAGKPL